MTWYYMRLDICDTEKFWRARHLLRTRKNLVTIERSLPRGVLIHHLINHKRWSSRYIDEVVVRCRIKSTLEELRGTLDGMRWPIVQGERYRSYLGRVHRIEKPGDDDPRFRKISGLRGE